MQPHEALILFGAALKWGMRKPTCVRFASWLVYHYWNADYEDIPDMPLAWTIYNETHREWLWRASYKSS